MKCIVSTVLYRGKSQPATGPTWKPTVIAALFTAFSPSKRTPVMGQNARTRITFSTLVLAVSLVLLLCFPVLPVAHAQTKPGPASAPPVTVNVIEVSPKALPLYTEYTGTTDSLDTVDVRAR